jgi:CheY-like chemotaxis protein
MSKKRVLIVDDEIDTLKLLKMIVEISGYEAYTTLNSLDALTLAQVEQPDVVLLDVMMPKMDGFQLCKIMRAHPMTRELPIIFVTAYSALDMEDRRVAAGGDMVLPKPVSMDSLIEAIEKVQDMERNIPDDIKQASSGIDNKANAASRNMGPAVPAPVATPAPTSTVSAAATTPPATPAPSAAPAAPTTPSPATPPTATPPTASQSPVAGTPGEKK